MQFFSHVSNKVAEGAAFLGKYTFPSSPAVFAISGGSSWYGKRVFLTYGPWLLTQLFLLRAPAILGSPFLGKVFAAVFVAPMSVPTLTPWLATIGAFVIGCTVCVLCNILAIHVFKIISEPTLDNEEICTAEVIPL